MNNKRIRELILLVISTIMICWTNKYILRVIGVILLILFIVLFINRIYIIKTKSNTIKGDDKLLFLEYILLFLAIYDFTKDAFSIGKLIMVRYGKVLGIGYSSTISILIIMWIIVTLIWIFKIPKEFTAIKAAITIFGVIIVVLFSSIFYYGNMIEDYNNYYSTVEIREDRGLFKSDGERVTERIDFLYFSGAIIFTVGYDDLSVVGSDLKMLIGSEMFMSYLLMCIFVPSIFGIVK